MMRMENIKETRQGEGCDAAAVGDKWVREVGTHVVHPRRHEKKTKTDTEDRLEC